MAVVLHKIAQQHTYYVQCQHDQAGNDDGRVHFFGDIDVEHFICHYRVNHADHRDKQRGQHIQGQHFFVRLVVMDKTF